MNKIKNYIKIVLFLSTPLLEAGILIKLTKIIGQFNTFSLVLLSTLIGFMFKYIRYKKVIVPFNEEMERYKKAKEKGVEKDLKFNLDISFELTLYWIGFVLFLTPGFITDILGFTTLFSKTRDIWKKIILGSNEKKY